MDSVTVAPMSPAPQTLQQLARNRIRYWLQSTEITQRDLCESIGQSQSWLSRYLHGKLDADVDILAKMAAAFGHSICALLTSPVDPAEAKLIEQYRAMPASSRTLLSAVLADWSRPHRVDRTRK